MSEKQLFNKSLPELREGFVRARLAQADVFGREDIAEWLELQRHRITPDESVWVKLLQKPEMKLAAEGQEIEILYNCSHPLSVPDGKGEDPQMRGRRQRIRPLLSRVTTGQGCEIHFGYMHGDILLIGRYGSEPMNPWTIVFTDRRDGFGEAVLVELSSLYVMDAVFAKWMRGCRKRHDRHSPASACVRCKAREFLCEVLTQGIAHERAKAEEDFDASVAVSEDGKQIVRADYVVVHEPKKKVKRSDYVQAEPKPGTWTVYKAEWFREHKFVRHHVMNRTHNISGGIEIVEDPTASPEDALQLFHNLRQTFRYLEPPLQAFVECRTAEKKLFTVLVSSPELFPYTLPEGGVEVEV